VAYVPMMAVKGFAAAQKRDSKKHVAGNP